MTELAQILDVIREELRPVHDTFNKIHGRLDEGAIHMQGQDARNEMLAAALHQIARCTSQMAESVTELALHDDLSKDWGNGLDELRILVLDDHKPVARLVRKLLHPMGADVAMLTSMSDARLHFAAQAPHILILDLKLSDGSGLRFLEWARERYPATQVIIASGNLDPDAEKAAQALGVPFLPKPFGFERLLELVRQAASKVRAG